jgi:hypothetical protein
MEKGQQGIPCELTVISSFPNAIGNVSSLSATITIFHPFHQPSTSSSSFRRLCAFHETMLLGIAEYFFKS